MDKTTGGPAFPCLEIVEYGSGPREENHTGMTLRDYAAIHADAPWSVVFNQLYLGLGHMNPTFDQVAEGMAVLRYKMADAMLVERELPAPDRLAAAAPDLLAALQAAVASGIIDHNGEPEAARAAIAKATGGAS